MAQQLVPVVAEERFHLVVDVYDTTLRSGAYGGIGGRFEQPPDELLGSLALNLHLKATPLSCILAQFGCLEAH